MTARDAFAEIVALVGVLLMLVACASPAKPPSPVRSPQERCEQELRGRWVEMRGEVGTVIGHRCEVPR